MINLYFYDSTGPLKPPVVFLAGPTTDGNPGPGRGAYQDHVLSAWRAELARILDVRGWSGTLVVPEFSTDLKGDGGDWFGPLAARFFGQTKLPSAIQCAPTSWGVLQWEEHRMAAADTVVAWADVRVEQPGLGLNARPEIGGLLLRWQMRGQGRPWAPQRLIFGLPSTARKVTRFWMAAHEAGLPVARTLDEIASAICDQPADKKLQQGDPVKRLYLTDLESRQAATGRVLVARYAAIAPVGSFTEDEDGTVCWTEVPDIDRMFAPAPKWNRTAPPWKPGTTVFGREAWAIRPDARGLTTSAGETIYRADTPDRTRRWSSAASMSDSRVRHKLYATKVAFREIESINEAECLLAGFRRNGIEAARYHFRNAWERSYGIPWHGWAWLTWFETGTGQKLDKEHEAAELNNA